MVEPFIVVQMTPLSLTLTCAVFDIMLTLGLEGFPPSFVATMSRFMIELAEKHIRHQGAQPPSPLSISPILEQLSDVTRCRKTQHHDDVV